MIHLQSALTHWASTGRAAKDHQRQQQNGETPERSTAAARIPEEAKVFTASDETIPRRSRQIRLRPCHRRRCTYILVLLRGDPRHEHGVQGNGVLGGA